jgi:hypothetical protein
MRRTRAFRAAYCMFLAAVSGASAAKAQSTAANTWAVTIVLPSKLIAGQPATLAVLGLDGRLADGISVDVGAGQKLKTDVSGRATFTVPSGAKYLIASASGASVAALVEENAAGLNNFSLKVPPVISQRDQFPICGGGFHGDASKNHVTFDRDPAFILAASPECLVVAAGTRAIPGPVKISIQSAPAQWTADSTVVGLNFDPPFPPPVPEKRSRLVLHAQGSEAALRVLVENQTPGILHFLHGDAQQVVTSGGPQNVAEIEVQAIAMGDFSFKARLLPEPNAESARRFLEAARTLASKEQKDEIKPLIDHLQHHPHDTFKVWIELRKIDLLTAAGDYRTLLEAARTALD